LGLYTTAAKKTISDGIQAVASRLKPAGDGKPRLYFLRDSLVERDRDLSARKLPTCFEEEIDSYVWKETPAGIKEEPAKENDHAQDACRYMTAYFDLVPNTVSVWKNIWS
jgi:phage terminase large subunit